MTEGEKSERASTARSVIQTALPAPATGPALRLIAPGGIPVERELLLFDIPLMTAVALLCIPVFISGRDVSRVEGGSFVVLYLGYLAYLLLLR